jgi:hypothetical protein
MSDSVSEYNRRHQQSIRDRMISKEEAAFRLNRSVRSLDRAIAAGLIKAVRLSPRKVGIRESELERLMEGA